MMRIVRWDVENVKRIKAVRIDADGALIQITGRNGQGKSSVIDALEMVLAGKRSECPEPVRRGAESARVILELDDLTVTKTWNKDGKSSLVVKAKDGSKYSRPQEILDKLVGRLSFDPLEFMLMDSPEQKSMLQEIAGLDFTKLDTEHKRVYDNRTDTNRELKRFEASLEQNASWADGPDEEVSITRLLTDQSNAQFTISQIDRFRDDNIDSWKIINAHETRIAEWEAKIKAAKQSISDLDTGIKSHEKQIEETTLPDIDAINKQIENAETTNEAARNKVRYKEGQKKRDELQSESAKQTARLAAIDEEKTEMVQAAKMPIDGLSFGDNEVLFDGLALENASQSQQLQISAAIGLALNPKLRLLLMRNGSLLDSAAMVVLDKFATANEAQIVIERVTDGEAIGVVIEDGELKD